MVMVEAHSFALAKKGAWNLEEAFSYSLHYTIHRREPPVVIPKHEIFPQPLLAT